jgi:hypothetical protein
VEVSGEDAPDVGAADHLGEVPLAAQLDEHGEVLHAGHRRVVEAQEGSVRGGVSSSLASHISWLRLNSPW